MKFRLAAIALLVVALAVLAGLFVLLTIDVDYAAIYAGVVLLIAALCTWLAARRTDNFARWRALLQDSMVREQRQQRWAAENPQDTAARRRARRHGLGFFAGGLVLTGVLGAAFWLGGLEGYALALVMPLTIAGLGLWMLVTGRYLRR